MSIKSDVSAGSAPRKIGYMRVSTKKQSLVMQRVALKNADCDVIYYDRGISGKVFPRKGLSKALAALCAGDSLVVYRQDRLGRIVLELEKLLHDLIERGVHLCVLSQPCDIYTAGGRFSYRLHAVLAQHESDIVGERTRDGMVTRKAAGTRFGRKLKLSPEQALAAQTMLALPDMSLTKVAAVFSVTANTVKRAIDRLESEGV